MKTLKNQLDSKPQAHWQSRVFVLTGGIGAGKTLAASIFRKLGAFVASADDIAHSVVAPETPGLTAVAKHFGPEVLTQKGDLDRKALAKIIFSDPQKRRELEGIVHPLVHKKAGQDFSSAFTHSFPCFLYDCPLYFEAGLDEKGFAGSIVVFAPPELCLQRCTERGMTREDAQRRMDSQLPQEKKKLRATYVLDNSGTETQLEEQCREVFQLISEKS